MREALHELSRKEFAAPGAPRRWPARPSTPSVTWWCVTLPTPRSPGPPVRDKHLAAAAWMEELAGGRVEDLAELLAHQLQALELPALRGTPAR